MANCEPLDLSSYTLKEFSEEEKLVHLFLLNPDYLKNPGLTNGKMGIIMWLLKLNQNSPSPLYENFAFELLEDIDKAMNGNVSGLPIDFRSGICGIGWAIEFLIRERLLQVEEDPCLICDSILHRALLNDRFKSIDVGKGISGVLLYLLFRIESSNLPVNSLPLFTNKRFIIYAIDLWKKNFSPTAIDTLLEEKNSKNFLDFIPLFLSEWEYPTLLWILGRIIHHKILPAEVSDLLVACLAPLADKKNYPQHPDNIRLLKNVIDILPQVNTPLINNIKHHLSN